jgi:hypothetical protein
MVGELDSISLAIKGAAECLARPEAGTMLDERQQWSFSVVERDKINIVEDAWVGEST